MKKIIFWGILVLILCSFSLTAFAKDFTDFNQSHWAYEYVDVLVKSGTINGFDDGSFRPESTVTRAEFVKMIGVGPDRRQTEFEDVSSGHWAYEYIMMSGLKPRTGNLFMPDVAITRGEVAELLWQRAGSPEDISAPPVIWKQGNKYAASWVYTNSIMTGDDNINLRLDDTLTRAEASALIVRSANVSDGNTKTYFYEKLDENVLKTAYEAFNLVNKPYSPDAKLTNGELAMAMARIVSDSDNPDYKNVSATVSFEHEYAQALNMLCRYYLGTDKDNAEYVDKNATVKDTVAALMFALSKSAHASVERGPQDGNYPGLTEDTGNEMKKLLSIAYNNGISFGSKNEIDLNREITLREFAGLLIEFDGFSGIYTADTISAGSYYKDYKLRLNLSGYPSNSESYRIILDSVPNVVYETPFISMVKTPSQVYSFTNDYKMIFESMLHTLVVKANNAGVKLAITYFPGMSVDNGNGYTMRVLINVEDAGKGIRMSDVINISDPDFSEKNFEQGEKFFADIETGVKITDIYLPTDKMNIVQIIK